jgi:transposase-like protein
MNARKRGWKRPGLNGAIRYSEAFKLEVVREVERDDLPFRHAQRKYGIKGCDTVQSWVRRYGNGSRGKVIRVQRPEEVDELKQLRRQLRQMQAALANAHVELAVERAYTRIACQRAGIKDVEEFKKKVDGTPDIKP